MTGAGDAHEANAVIIGTPIYYAGMTGEAASLIHRMLFPTVLYEVDQANDRLNPIRKKCGLIVTSQVSEEVLRRGYNYPYLKLQLRLSAGILATVKHSMQLILTSLRITADIMQVYLTWIIK